MRFALNDIITAIATPPGISAIAVIRVSGNNAVSTVANFFDRPQKLTDAAGYQAVHGYILDGTEPVDEVICIVYRSPHSYTGEEMTEIFCHGNPDLTARILQLLLKNCRLAEPGEFTFRAFMNHKLDLAQAEAVNDLISAQTGKSEQAALSQLRGNLSREIDSIVKELTDCRIRFELAIDFADQDLPELDWDEVQSRMEKVHNRLEELLAGGKQGRILRDGYTVCLSGAPNVGKSSIFNRFLQENRALVTPVPGTTRDYLEEWLSLEGYPVRLQDTAGLHSTNDEVEILGIRRTQELMQKADLVVILTDPDSLEEQFLLPENVPPDKILCFMNKIDLLGFDKLPSNSEWKKFLAASRFHSKIKNLVQLAPCSAVLADGLDTLKKLLLERISLPNLQPSSVLVTNTRHLAALQKCLDDLNKALEGTKNRAGYEFIAFDLIAAVSALAEITGAITTDDLLDNIFSSFCIGK